jgi:hypothetical protein
VLYLNFILSLSTVSSFVPFTSINRNPTAAIITAASKKGVDDGMHHHHSFATGSFVEFVEKKRTHIGKIDMVEHKSSGCSYQVIDSDGKKFHIPDKDILYSIPCPNTPDQATKLYDEFCLAHDTLSLQAIQDSINVSPDLLVMAWEEVAGDNSNSVEQGGSSDHLLTPASFIELVHAHTATTLEKYMAWKFLQSETSHVFFKEIREHGRVVSFKAKTRKAVEAAKDVFCRAHQYENVICFL